MTNPDNERMTSEPSAAAVRIQLASPEAIRGWSQGEVTRPGLLAAAHQPPERGGLFCERIFGPLRDWCCACVEQRHEGREDDYRFWGPLKKGHSCPVCGVEVNLSLVRRQRLGHIELAAPVLHPWFLRGRPGTLAILLGLGQRRLQQVLDFEAHLIIDSGGTPLSRWQALTDEELDIARRQNGDGFRVATGIDAIRQALRDLDPAALARQVRGTLGSAKAGASRALVRRLRLVEALRDSGNQALWLVLECLPVIPADLRPMQWLEARGHRPATRVCSDLNLLYQTVLEINARLRDWTRRGAMQVLLRHEQRRLQRAVNALFDNGRLEAPVPGLRGRPLKSLTDALQGKQGRFRQNLLGKRVDFSGRAVIVAGPELALHQCGLPRVLARQLFEPLLLGRLARRWREQLELSEPAALLIARLALKGHDETVRRLLREWLTDAGADLGQMDRAQELLTRREEAIDGLLDELAGEQLVLLNRAPSLHRMNVQAFEPVLIDERVLRLPPLACEGFNADFDGDTMAVHVPLSSAARAEAALLMRPIHNLLSPANGRPQCPSNEIVLGLYYLTVATTPAPAEELRLPLFADLREVVRAQEHGKIRLHDWIEVRLPPGKEVVDETGCRRPPRGRVRTTVGRALVNELLPAALPFHDLALTRSALGEMMLMAIRSEGRWPAAALLDRLKDLGLAQATRAGLSFLLDDLHVPQARAKIVEAARKRAEEVNQAWRAGAVDDHQRQQRLTQVWSRATAEITEQLEQKMTLVGPDGHLNTLVLMVRSGARGKWDQLRQLAGLRGLMARASGGVCAISGSLREGLGVHDYFLSAHGARKAGADKAALPESGYLTRKLIDVAHAVVVTEEDCGTPDGLRRPLSASLIGRYLAEADRALTPADVEKLRTEAGRLTVRSPVTCRTRDGVCQRCYGFDPATAALVELGTPVGILAAQSVGEPGTQLAMRTKHTGGVVLEQDLVSGLRRVVRLLEAQRPRRSAVLAPFSGTVEIRQTDGTTHLFVIPQQQPAVRVVLPADRLRVRHGQRVRRGQALTEGEPALQELLPLIGRRRLATYLLRQLQTVYRDNGVLLADQHFEVFLARMLNKVEVLDGGDSTWLPGDLIDARYLHSANRAAAGRVLKEGENSPRPVRGRAVVLGISRVALLSEGFLSAASFQQTARVLAAAALAGRCDELRGLKENVILGRPIPAGTGFPPRPTPLDTTGADA